MKHLTLLLLLSSIGSFAQLRFKDAKAFSRYHQGILDSDYRKFENKKGYSAGIVLTRDGGAAFMSVNEEGDKAYPVLVILDSVGCAEWKVQLPLLENDVMEPHSVLQDKNGNFYLFIASYNHAVYRGPAERVVFMSEDGKVIWDKTLGPYAQAKSPHVAWAKLQDDGRVALRGHITPTPPAEGSDPTSHFWEGWINSKGELEQITGDVIVWTEPFWQEFIDEKD